MLLAIYFRIFRFSISLTVPQMLLFSPCLPLGGGTPIMVTNPRYYILNGVTALSTEKRGLEDASWIGLCKKRGSKEE